MIKRHPIYYYKLTISRCNHILKGKGRDLGRAIKIGFLLKSSSPMEVNIIFQKA